MRRATILFVATAIVSAHAAPVHAQHTRDARRSAESAIPANLSALLRSYPNGGDGLSAAVTDALTNDETSAPSMVDMARKGNPDQKASIALGAVRALNLMQTTNPGGARAIRAAMRNGDPVFRAILAALEGRSYSQNEQGSGRGNLLFFPGTGGFSSGSGGDLARPLASPN